MSTPGPLHHEAIRRVLADDPRPKGEVAAAIDRLFDDVLREGVDRETIWPLLYEYRASGETPPEPDLEGLRMVLKGRHPDDLVLVQDILTWLDQRPRLVRHLPGYKTMARDLGPNRPPKPPDAPRDKEWDGT